METIVAPITAPGAAAVSVIRLSGGKSVSILEKLVKRSKEVLLNPGMMVFTTIWDKLEEERQVLDQSLVAYFRAPRSFTGEDVVEFHLHGSPYLTFRLLENIQALGARMARAGEFSERAFLNGQIDLAQAEAIADLINSETKAQTLAAQDQLSGKLSSAISDLGEPLRNTLAEIEAYIDFPEEDIEPETYLSWCGAILEVSKKVENYISSFSTGKLYREGAKVVLCGLPNAGKSSLLNLLLGEDRAIVTEIAGTTRDSIEEKLSINGLLVRITDTAGLAEDYVPGEVESLGIERTWREVESADLVLYLHDLSISSGGGAGLLERIEERAQRVLVVGNKWDLESKEKDAAIYADIKISALKEIGVNDLKTKIYDLLIPHSNSNVLICSSRHHESLLSAKEFLKRASLEIESKNSPEFVSLEIRGALGALTEIVGVTHTEEILGKIFSKFCIGK